MSPEIMKRILLFLIVVSFPIMAESKEIAKNPDTGMTLTEIKGLYYMKSNTGIIMIGDTKQARDVLNMMNICFTKEKLSEVINCGDQEYRVKRDDEGMYIMKVGLGAMKIRATDSALFFTVIEGKIIKDKGKKIWEIIKE